MFYLENILGMGYQAHVLLYRSESRANDANEALTVSDTNDEGPAVIIQDLIGGDISAQARPTYNSTVAVSLIQTLENGAEDIEADLNAMLEQVEKAQTGV
ncbi:MAG: hypothetical protein MI922_04345, partial [Bacteroidales bacterium]|nr:hypothetical protein [Bacteroidales bacterium]